MHVNPGLQEKGFVMLFNPTDDDMLRKIKLPFYYTGLTETAIVKEKEGEFKKYNLARDYSISINVTILANSYTWLVIN